MRRKTLLIVLAVVPLLLAAAGIFLAVRIRSREPVRVDAFFHLYASPAREELEFLLGEFELFYPEIELETRIEPYRDLLVSLNSAVDARSESEEKRPVSGIVSVLAGGDLALIPPDAPRPSPWMLTAWGLYYNRERLGELGFEDGSLESLGASGLDGFIDALAPLTGPDETLFATGTRFFWPWLTWIQHLELLNRGGAVPSGYEPEDWRRGIDAFDRLVRDGLINADHKQANFAQSQLAVSDGRALFVLSDSGIYSVYPPEDRAGLGFLPFPGSAGQGWRIGSGLYLAAFTSEDRSRRIAAAEELLLNYLHSEGVGQRFLKSAGIRLLGRDESGEVLNEIPSLTQMAGDPDLQNLLKYLR